VRKKVENYYVGPDGIACPSETLVKEETYNLYI